MNTFGQVVKALRSVEGLTLEHCAKRIGSHKGYWSGIENEKVNPPSVAIVRKIAKLFEKRLADLKVGASAEDWIELAWVSKSPLPIRERAFHRVRGNPLARLEIRITQGRPQVVTPALPERVDMKPTAAPPAGSELLPGEKAAS